MTILDVLAVIQIGNGTGNFQDPVVRPGRKAQPLHGITQSLLAALIQHTIALQQFRCHLGIGVYSRELLEPQLLYLPCLDHPFANLHTRLATTCIRQLIVRDRQNFNV